MHILTLITVLPVLAIFVIAVIPVDAITNGALDGNGHPYVGQLVAHDANDNPLWRSNGTLSSSTLFLTAGRCTEAPAAHVEICFDTNVESGIPANRYPFTGNVGGTPYTHLDHNSNAFYLYDPGVVVLDNPMVILEYGALTVIDMLDGQGSALALLKSLLIKKGV